jgi:Tol biopolymer transport system component/DNA-binding winged helix-turn-helix (wHTH) protein
VALPGGLSDKIRFGPFEVNLSAAELRKHGVRLRLQEQPFQVLAALLERPGDVVTREDLIRRLWPDGTAVDFDRGLNAAVTRLRQALSDSAESPRYVETVARRGYRFVAPVESISESAPPIAAPEPAAGRSWILPAVVLGGIVAIAAIWWSLAFRNTNAVEAPLSVAPLTSEQGFERRPSFSPDGSQVAFEWDQGAGTPHIYLKVVGTGDPVRLTSSPAAEYSPAWSRDGRQIAFLRDEVAPTMGVYVVPALGGVERKVAEFVKQHWVLDSQLRLQDWMPDSRHLIVSGTERPGGREDLFLVRVDSGERRPLTKPAAAGSLQGDREPAVSPDGRSVAFTRGSLSIDETLYVLSLSADLHPVGEPRKLTRDRRSRSPVWTPDGKEIVFLFGPQLSRIGLAAQATPRAILPQGGNIASPTLSANGRLAFSQSTRDSNIWRQEISDRAGEAPAPVQLIASSHNDQDAQYSPDGTRIAYQSNRSGRSEIWACGSDGAHCVPVTNFQRPYITGTPRWSPDGKWIVFDSASEDGFHIYVVDSRGGSPRRLTEGPGNNVIPSWSKDGNWIYYSREKDGQQELWKIPSRGGSPTQVTRTGGMTTFESPDGRFLYYTKTESDTRLWRSAPDGSGETEVLNGVAHRGFALAPDRIYYLRDEPGEQIAIRRFLMSTREDTRIATINKPTYLGLSLAPDGRYLIYSQFDHEGADLMLVSNFK